MINIYCIKYGNKYSAKYVNRLQNMIERNTTLNYRFFCLTDDPSDLNCETIELPKDLDGNTDYPLASEKLFHKITLLEESQKFNNDSAFFDLDLLIQGNIDKYLIPSDKLKLCLRTWGDIPEEIKLYKKGLKDYPSLINSSVMCWKPYMINSILEAYYSTPRLTFSFDKWLTSKCLRHLEYYDKEGICSYSYMKEYNKFADICLFNGDKNEYYTHLDFVKENWK